MCKLRAPTLIEGERRVMVVETQKDTSKLIIFAVSNKSGGENRVIYNIQRPGESGAPRKWGPPQRK
jgi:hypothetical protein